MATVQEAAPTRDILPHKSNKPEEATLAEIQALIRLPSSKVSLIDVREPSEVALGIIPTAHHIPMASLRDALVSLSDQEFEHQFGEWALGDSRDSRRTRKLYFIVDQADAPGWHLDKLEI